MDTARFLQGSAVRELSDKAVLRDGLARSSVGVLMVLKSVLVGAESFGACAPDVC